MPSHTLKIDIVTNWKEQIIKTDLIADEARLTRAAFGTTHGLCPKTEGGYFAGLATKLMTSTMKVMAL